MKHSFRQLDHTITTWLYMRPANVAHIYEWITLLGHPVVVVFLAMLVVIAALGFDKPATAAAFIVGLIALALGSALKFVLRRPRPSTPYAARMKQHTFSFPSGHAYGAGIVYGLIIYQATQLLLSPWAEVMMIGLVPLIFLIGLSRVYLGAHYFFDVLGGWLLAIPVVYYITAHFLA